MKSRLFCASENRRTPTKTETDKIQQGLFSFWAGDLRFWSDATLSAIGIEVFTSLIERTTHFNLERRACQDFYLQNKENVFRAASILTSLSIRVSEWSYLGKSGPDCSAMKPLSTSIRMSPSRALDCNARRCSQPVTFTRNSGCRVKVCNIVPLASPIRA